MTDVFISYAREDRSWAEKLSRVIRQRGFSIWWDRKIRPGRTFDEEIQEALSEAKSVIVLWSSSSVKSDFVKDEAQRAAGREVLIPILIHDVPIPLGFGRIQTANLVDWDNDEFDSQFEHVIESIAIHAGRQLAFEERTGFRVLPPLPEMAAQLASQQPGIDTVAGARPSHPPSPEPRVEPVAILSRRGLAISAVLCILSMFAGALGIQAYHTREEPSLEGVAREEKQLVAKDLSPEIGEALVALDAAIDPPSLSGPAREELEREAVVAPARPRFAARADTVEDSQTGLSWSREVLGTGDMLSWNNAVKICDELRLAGHDDWRLPSVVELLTMAGFRRWFELAPGVRTLWSADRKGSGKARLFDLSSGGTRAVKARKKQTNAVLCVR